MYIAGGSWVWALYMNLVGEISSGLSRKRKQILYIMYNTVYSPCVL